MRASWHPSCLRGAGRGAPVPARGRGCSGVNGTEVGEPGSANRRRRARRRPIGRTEARRGAHPWGAGTCAPGTHGGWARPSRGERPGLQSPRHTGSPPFRRKQAQGRIASGSHQEGARSGFEPRSAWLHNLLSCGNGETGVPWPGLPWGAGTGDGVRAEEAARRAKIQPPAVQSLPPVVMGARRRRRR